MPTDDDPFALSDMDLAVKAIREAISQNKKICIFGDYDVDGVCATVILYKTLKRLTDNLIWYIPSRQNEGYGMHKSSIRKLFADGVEFIITVDNGISAMEEAELATELGIDLVITDHHRYAKHLPKALAVVASSRNEYSANVNDLSGAGVAWMLSRALTGENLHEYLPFVALAIAADSVRVTDYNRAYLKNSFPLFSEDEHFQLILKNAGADKTPVSMYTLNFILAPRINAAGRMAHADVAVRFFLANTIAERESYASLLEELNHERKTEEIRIFDACVKDCDNSKNVLVFRGEDWNIGVIGIVASRLTEVFHKNVFVLGGTESGVYVGSGRSDSLTDLYGMLLPCASLLDRFGGHAGAAGLTVSRNNLPAFIDAVNASYERINPSGPPPRKTEYDLEISTKDCSVALVKEIDLLSPFGPGNPEPVFRFSNVCLSGVSVMGKEHEHLSARIQTYSQGRSDWIRLVAFKCAREYQNWLSAESVSDVLATLCVNSFRSVETCEARFIAYNSDLVHSEAADFVELVNAFFAQLRYNNIDSVLSARAICASLGYPKISEERLRDLYRHLIRKFRGCSETDTILTTEGTAEELAALLIFTELGITCCDGFSFSFTELKTKTDCRNSLLFKTLNSNDFGGKNNGTQQVDQKHS